MANLKEEVMARLLDRTWPDAVLAIYKEPDNDNRSMVIAPGDHIRLNMTGVSILIQNTSQKDIYLRGEQ